MCSTGGMATNPGLSYIWEDEAERQRTEGGSLEDLQPPPSPPRPDIAPSDSEVFYRALLKEKLQAAVAALAQVCWGVVVRVDSALGL